ncbi:MAG: hypothetical protein JSU82_02990 [Rhodospirillales bacterium]|nr:MAG: hypothetical protein JSU82_02990 [Rhodospirillales bacterium]
MIFRLAVAGLMHCGLVLPAACTATGDVEGTAPTTGVPSSRVEADMVRLINEQRARRSLPPLIRQPKLSAAALAHSRIMGKTGCIAFDCAGMSVEQRVAVSGYRYGEARSYVGAGYDNTGAALAAMMGRGWSRELVLDPDFRHVGVGHVFESDSRYRHYWTISFAVPATDDREALAEEVVRLTNAERRKRGLGPLMRNRDLTRSAQFHAEFMARNDCFAHRCPKEPALAQRARNAGYRYRGVAENIAAGSPTPAEVVRGWMESPGHRANILHPDMREIGIGYVLLNEDSGRESHRHYWVQNFGYR